MRFSFWWWRRNEEFNEEIQGHLELAARENMESGLAPKDAHTAARHWRIRGRNGKGPDARGAEHLDKARRFG